jgi:hypothetical protein
MSERCPLQEDRSHPRSCEAAPESPAAETVPMEEKEERTSRLVTEQQARRRKMDVNLCDSRASAPSDVQADGKGKDEEEISRTYHAKGSHPHRIANVRSLDRIQLCTKNEKREEGRRRKRKRAAKNRHSSRPKHIALLHGLVTSANNQHGELRKYTDTCGKTNTMQEGPFGLQVSVGVLRHH